MKRTPFYSQIVAAGGVMAEVQGWAMPNEFSGARAEHLAVRGGVGFSDWSSTGEIEVQGRDAVAAVQRVIVNDAAAMPIGKVLYTTMCRPDGSILSDITVYRFGERRFWLMTAWGSNRANERPELDWLDGQLVRHGRLHQRRVVRGRAPGRAGSAGAGRWSRP